MRGSLDVGRHAMFWRELISNDTPRSQHIELQSAQMELSGEGLS
jgi:hypothetical protein